MVYESQILNLGDYFILIMGCMFVVIICDKDGELYVLVNVCLYCGVQFCCFKCCNQKIFICLFYGWIFFNIGKFLKVKDFKGVGYFEQFNKDGFYDLIKVVCFENYCGFLFGFFNVDVKLLEEYFGEVCKMVDMIVDQVDEGFEVLCGLFIYIYDGNWKLQVENGVDGYYVLVVYWNYVVMMVYCIDDGKEDNIKVIDVFKWVKQCGGFYVYENGYILFWMEWVDLINCFGYLCLEEWMEKYGKIKVEWMVGVLCNFCFYLNVFLMDQFFSQICVFWFVLVDKIEVMIYCIVLKGESQEVCI